MVTKIVELAKAGREGDELVEQPCRLSKHPKPNAEPAGRKAVGSRFQTLKLSGLTTLRPRAG